MFLVLFLLAINAVFAQQQPDPGCEASQAWITQESPMSDPTGRLNVGFQSISGTSWVTYITPPQTVTLHGTFPAARAMSVAAYYGTGTISGDLHSLVDAGIIDFLQDQDINPDPGQNNPFVSGTALGTFTIQAIWSDKPSSNPQPNTLYLGSHTSLVHLAYRVVYATDPNDLAGDVPLPAMTIGGAAMTNCAVRPIVTPQDATVWGRLAFDDFTGVSNTSLNPSHFPTWTLFPSSESGNAFMAAVISRQFLVGDKSLVVVKMERPTFPDNREGVLPYTPSQVRFWSLAEKEPISTASVRAIADGDAAVSGDSSVFVICDPSLAPSADTLAIWGATWIAWGALYPGDFVYSMGGTMLTNEDGVFWYGLVWYTQILANPGFAQSIENVSQLGPSQQKAAMGAYWPSIGYCSLASFTSSGAGCIGQ